MTLRCARYTTNEPLVLFQVWTSFGMNLWVEASSAFEAVATIDPNWAEQTLRQLLHNGHRPRKPTMTVGRDAQTITCVIGPVPGCREEEELPQSEFTCRGDREFKQPPLDVLARIMGSTR